MLDFIEGFVELVVGTIREVIKEGIGQTLLAPFFYVPGFVLLFMVTFGSYPPAFLGERGQWPSILLSVALWLGVGLYFGVLPP